MPQGECDSGLTSGLVGRQYGRIMGFGVQTTGTKDRRTPRSWPPQEDRPFRSDLTPAINKPAPLKSARPVEDRRFGQICSSTSAGTS